MTNLIALMEFMDFGSFWRGQTKTGSCSDNVPILARPDATSALAFVTLRGGGLFVVNPRVSPMAIVGEYTKATIQPAGLLAIQPFSALLPSGALVTGEPANSACLLFSFGISYSVAIA